MDMRRIGGVTTYETDRITETGKESRVEILVIDDEEKYLEYVSRTLTEEGYDVLTANSPSGYGVVLNPRAEQLN